MLLALVVGGTPAVAATDQWYLDKVGIPAAHGIARGDGVVIGMFTDAAAVGNDELTDDPDMVGRFLPGTTFADGEPTSSPPAGDPDDVFIASEPLMVSAGRSGLVGVAPGAKILPVAGDAFGGNQIRWMVDNGARVINYYRHGSAGNPDTTKAEAAALRYALSKDVVVVVDSASAQAGPKVPGVIVVGATDRDDRRVTDPRTSESLPDRPPALVAPNSRRLELPPGDLPSKYWDSAPIFPEEAAVAIVAGVAALVRSKYPGLNAASIVERMVRTAHDLGPAGRDDEFGYGLVDAAAALDTDIAPVATNPLGEPKSDDGTTWVIPVVATGGLLVLLAGVVTVVVRRRRRPA